MFGWILIAVFVLFLILLYLTPIRVKVSYGRTGENDNLVVEITAWFRLIRLSYEIPILTVKPSKEEAKLVTKVEKTKGSSSGGDSVNEIGPALLKKIFDNYQEFLERVTNLKSVTKDFLAHIRCHHLEWHTSLGLGDAAETGALTGIVWGVKSMIIAVFSHHFSLRTMPRISVQPIWNDKIIRTHFTCILTCRLGYAMVAGIRILLRLRKGREQKWQTTPSRA